MKRLFTIWLLPVCLLLMMSSCFLFKKTSTATLPPRTPEKPVSTEEAPVKPPKKEVARAPFHVRAFGQKILKPVYNVALFTPLNIDEVTSDTGFSVNNRTPLPAPTMAGLEFYEGVLMAQDTLLQQGIPIRLYVYDTKSTSNSLKNILNSHQLDSIDLMIGAVNNTELKAISHFAKDREINFVSATYPNDAGIEDNPFLTILNSTLRAHCTGLQDFIQQKFYNKNILAVYQDNTQEKQILEYLQEANKEMTFNRKSAITPFNWTNNTTIDQLKAHLQKDKNNVIIITALYSQVALSIIGQLIPLTKEYTINVVGMPTLDGNTDLKKSEYKGINIYYSTPYPYAHATENPSIKSMMWEFFGKYRSRPSDMAIKGYETLYYFGHQLQKNGVYFNGHMNDVKNTLLTQFSIQPIYKKEDNKDEAPDYFENKKLYFMQVRDGKVTPAR